jgi:hypothetical protein
LFAPVCGVSAATGCMRGWSDSNPTKYSKTVTSEGITCQEALRRLLDETASWNLMR